MTGIANHQPLRVLLLEDEPSDAHLILKALGDAGLVCQHQRVDTAASFKGALTHYCPSVILADCSLRTLNILDALAEARETAPMVPFIVITDPNKEVIAMECLKAGACDYLWKDRLARVGSGILAAVSKQSALIERRQAVEALQESEERFRRFADVSFEGVGIHVNGVIKDVSPRFAMLVGATPEEIIGRSVLEWVIPESQELVRQHFQSDSLDPYEVTALRKDGSRIQLEVRSQKIPYQGQAARVSVIRDITERKRAQEILDKLAAFPKLNPNPVLEFGADGTLTYYNDATAELALSLKCKDPSKILPPGIAEIVRECLTTGQKKLRLETVLEGRTISWSFFPIMPLRVVHCYAGDITDRLDLEVQLRQSQKMESVGQLAAGVAHDFNNLLTVIQGHTGLLQGMTGLIPEALTSIRHIADAASRAASLTRQLLMFSRRQTMQLQALDLNEVVGGITKLLHRVIGEDITLKINYGPALPLVHADPGMVEQVLMNLAVNARDAMPNGGVLKVETSLFHADEAFLAQRPELQPGRYIRMTVSDTGCGMDAHTMRHIFEPFFTTKEVGKGTGLGLATAYGIVKQHGGWIHVESEPGQGTTFHIYWPETTGPCEESQAATTPPAPSPKGRECILVVEDDDSLRELEYELLTRQGYQVVAAKNGIEALELWKQRHYSFDLLLTDMIMPEGVSGKDLACQIWEEEPKLKVLFTTGYSFGRHQKELPQKEEMSFLQKPFQPAMLAQAVRDCLDGRSFRS